MLRSKPYFATPFPNRLAATNQFLIIDSTHRDAITDVAYSLKFMVHPLALGSLFPQS